MTGVVLFSIRQNLNLKQRLKKIIGNLSQHEEGLEATLDYEVISLFCHTTFYKSFKLNYFKRTFFFLPQDLCRQQIQIANSKRTDTIEKISTKPNNPVNIAKRSQDGKAVEAPLETLSPSRSSTSSW